jgi:4-carboxymuconolactone decarboxylase
MAEGTSGQRLAPIALEAMTPEQKQVAEAIMAGPRGGLRGPFNAWLRSPELADRYQRVGEYLRFHSSLGPRLNEMAILMTAAHWQSPFEWYAHAPLALKAGLAPETALAIARGERPAGMREDEAVVWAFCSELRERRNVSDATYAAALALWGERGIVDLIGVNGYYDAVSMTLNVAGVLPPAEAGVPIAPPPR